MFVPSPLSRPNRHLDLLRYVETSESLERPSEAVSHVLSGTRFDGGANSGIGARYGHAGPMPSDSSTFETLASSERLALSTTSRLNWAAKT